MGIFNPVIAGGGGVSSGAKNYLTAYVPSTSGVANTGNGDFELNATTGWSLAHSSLISNFPSTVGSANAAFSSAGGSHGGSAASGNLALTIANSGSSSAQIAGLFSASYASSAATTAGDMLISDAFSIDLEDQAKVMTFKFYYSVISNAGNGNYSGTSSNSFGVAIYDVSGAAWIMPAGVWGMTQNAGVGYCTGTFQTTGGGQKYQIAVFNANATAGSTTLYFDDFSVGPQTAPMGPAMTDFIAYTPTFTGFGTPSNVNFVWRRVGDCCHVIGWFTPGTNTATQAAITLPSGLTGAGSPKITSTQVFGVAVVGNNQPAMYIITGASTTTVGLSEQQSGSASGLTFINGSALSNAVNIAVDFMIPITGWSSNCNMSNDTDTRVVALQSNGASTAVSGSYSTLQWINTINDTHAAMGSTQYLIPVTGYYNMASQVILSGTQALNGTAAFQFIKNGSVIQEFSEVFGGAVTGNNAVGLALNSIKCNAGDTIAAQIKSSALTPAIVASTSDNFLTINRASGPAVIAATESVNMRYTNIAGTSIANSGSDIQVTFATKDYDSHGAYASGTYTAPISGKYRVSVTFNFPVSTVYAVGNLVYASVYKNSSLHSYGPLFTAPTTSGIGIGVAVIATVNCNAGDTIYVAVSNNRTAGATTLATTAGDNHLEIERVGN